MSERETDNHWLVRAKTIRWLWIGFIAVLAATVLADLFVDHHGKFSLDGTFGFSAWYGFAACFVLIVFAKGLGVILKRRDDYYGG
jgi:uncharacterized membrane protein